MFNIIKGDTLFVSGSANHLGWRYKHDEELICICDKNWLRQELDKKKIETNISTDEILYIMSDCTIARAHVRNQFKCTNKKDKSTLRVFPTNYKSALVNDYSRYTNYTLLEYKDNYYLKLIDPSIKKTEKQIAVEETRGSSKLISLNECKIIQQGDFCIFPKKYFYVRELVNLPSSVRITTEDLIQSKIPYQKITVENLHAIIELLESGTTPNLFLGYKLISELDYIHNRRLIKTILDKYPNPRNSSVTIDRMKEVIHSTKWKEYNISLEERNLIIAYNQKQLEQDILETLQTVSERYHIPFEASVDITFNALTTNKIINCKNAANRQSN